MAETNFKINWIGHCAYGNRIWGWFYDRSRERQQCNYCFWATIGKSISFTKYAHHNTSAINFIQLRKIQNKYDPITIEELIKVWPNFMQDLQNKFIWDKLSEKI